MFELRDGKYGAQLNLSNPLEGKNLKEKFFGSNGSLRETFEKAHGVQLEAGSSALSYAIHADTPEAATKAKTALQEESKKLYQEQRLQKAAASRAEAHAVRPGGLERM